MPPSDRHVMLQLTQDLERMRDSLVELALSLRDYQLSLDGPERREAGQVVAKLLNRLQH